MANYRDPKVTTTTDRKRGMGTWIAIAIAAIIVLLLLFWWLGGGNDVETVDPVATDPAVEEPAEGDAVIVPADPAEPTAPVQQ